MVDDAALDAQWIADHIPALMADRDRLADMRRRAWGYGIRDAAQVMAEQILTMAANTSPARTPGGPNRA